MTRRARTAAPQAWRDVLDSRYTLCRHEGAHAVTAYVLGIPFRYVTTSPRAKGHAGHVMPRGRYAVATLVARWDAVEAVTYALHDSPRALTERDVARIVDDISPTPDAATGLPEEHARPWFLDYSRLTWEPKSSPPLLTAAY